MPAERRGDEHERPRPPGVLEGEVERDLAAEGVADDAGALDPHVVEESGEVVHIGERPTGQRRVPVAAEVVADDAVPLGERRELPIPEPPVADGGVEEDDGRPVAGRVVGDLGAVEARGAQLDWDSRRRRAIVCRRAQATFGCSSTNGRNSQGVSP